MAALKGAISVGRRANTCLFSIPSHLRTTHNLNRPNQFLQYQKGVGYSIRAINGSAVAQKKKENEESSSSENWKVKMLYDGDCPLCMREVDMLRKRNKSYGTIKFVDISSEDYSPEDNQGLDYETAMGRIHAIESDGRVLTNVEAFRRFYEVVGLGWVYAITKYEPIASIADAVYGVWAKYRLQVTGRPPLEEVLEARRKKVFLCCTG
ncbi:hypothetical protein RD792_008764 [Penstemon davidsonii]|uniref:Thiol-disulfide oxidoreductase DCC n=1 Tax=Penstemon davidsonii TaxID=160366 RepID=A0ABR0DAW9_9LAMI|nr:hypothetical protein RD792_008764 [Penstemon davidsonii]